MSSTEEEYVVATTIVFHAVWIRILLKDMGHIDKDPNPILCGNRSTIALSKHHVFLIKSKHIDTRYHFIRELVSNEEITLLFSRSKEQVANMFTKPLGTLAFEFQRQHLGIDDAKNIVLVDIKGEC